MDQTAWLDWDNSVFQILHINNWTAASSLHSCYDIILCMHGNQVAALNMHTTIVQCLDLWYPHECLLWCWAHSRVQKLNLNCSTNAARAFSCSHFLKRIIPALSSPISSSTTFHVCSTRVFCVSVNALGCCSRAKAVGRSQVGILTAAVSISQECTCVYKRILYKITVGLMPIEAWFAL